MSFLAPWFLVGALAVALPIVFHLIRRTTRERTPFSSLIFLNPSPPRLTRRSRLEHLLLLALRCLVLGLLALGFARPLFRKDMPGVEASSGSRKIVLLVDTSASMRRADLWSAALARAESVLRKTTPSDQVAVYTFDRQIHPLVDFEEWTRTGASERVGMTLGKLTSSSPGWSATRLGDALMSAAEVLVDAGGKAATGPRQIVVVTDLKEGAKAEALQGYEWPKGIEVWFDPLKAKSKNNASLHLLTDTEGSELNTSNEVRVRISNGPDSKREQFKVGWAEKEEAGFAGKPVDVYVPAGQSRVVTLRPPLLPSDRVILQGDDEVFDNTVFVASPEARQVRVLYFGAGSEKDPHQPLYFLQRVFQQTRSQSIKVVVCPDDKPLLPQELEGAGLIIATGKIPDQNAQFIRGLVTSGKTLLFALTGESDRVALSRILGLADLDLREAHPAGYAMLSEIDFRHPLFLPFADPRFSDFTKIHFWRYRVLSAAEIPGARVLAKFDNNDPALLETSIGKGRVLVLASTWRPDDSQLALSTKFVPLLYAMLEESSGPAAQISQYYVGDAIPVASEGLECIVRSPDGSELRSGLSDTNFSRTMTPGIYTAISEDSRKTARFAVNLDPAESRIRPMGVDEFERLGVPLGHQAAYVVAETSRTVQLQNTELERRQKLWHWFVLGTAGALLVETWLAGITMRRVALEGAKA